MSWQDKPYFMEESVSVVVAANPRSCRAVTPQVMYLMLILFIVEDVNVCY